MLQTINPLHVVYIFILLNKQIQMNPTSYRSLPSMGTFNSQTNINDTSQKIQLYISGRSLLDLDVFSKSDPYVKVFFKRSPMHKEFLIGKTQTVQNDLNPNWIKTFLIDYIFQAKQQIRFQVYDEDDGTNDDFIGQAVTTVGALAGAKNQTSILDLVNPKSNKSKLGKLIIRVESSQQSNQYLRMKWKGRKLLNTDSFFDFWDKSDPYLKFLKIRTDNSFIEVARTQIIMDNLNPSWKPLEVSLGKLLNTNEPSSKFKIQCWDWEKEGENHHQFIGQIYTTLGEFSALSLPYQFKMNNPKYKNPGYLILQNRDIIVRPTFIDYLRGGLELNLSIAIDFTGSNGTPTHPTSLHYMNPSKPNQYQVAIDAVARILLNYDSDQCIPAFGFGAKPHYPMLNMSSVSHCFPLSGNPQQTSAFGYEHLMNMYCNAIQHLELSGPTYFGPILRQAINISRMSMQQGSNVYQILLILTDGEIHDMDETVNLLVNNCELPLSLIIVGVGNAQFSNMERLDGDNGLYASNGKKARRDIVQFVPFREVQLNPDLLAQELLAELPTQVTQYMAMIGKQPGVPQEANVELMMEQRMEMKPQQALKNQLMNLFQQNPNNFSEGKM